MSVTLKVETPLEPVTTGFGEITELVLPCPSVMLLPEITLVYASSRVTVTVAEAAPLSTTMDGLATTVDTVEDAGPGPDGVILLAAEDRPADDAVNVYDVVSRPPKVQPETSTTP